MPLWIGGGPHPRMMQSLPSPAQMAALVQRSVLECCGALRVTNEANLDKVHSINGFILGIIRRVEESGTQDGPGDLQKLPRKVRHRLEDLIDERRISKEEIDVRMVHR